MSSPADLAGRRPAGPPTEPDPTQHRPGSRRRWLLITAGAVAVALLAAGSVRVVHNVVQRLTPGEPPLAAGAWATHRTAAEQPVTDAAGTVWTPDPGLAGGRTVPLTRAQWGTASPQLYAAARLGAGSWTVTVPRPGSYAVDLLVADLPKRQRAMFDVLADDGESTPVIVGRVDTATWSSKATHHVTGLVQLDHPSLRLTFRPSNGKAAVTGLIVTSGPPAPRKTLLDNSFDGPAGGPVPKPWTHETGYGPWGAGELEGYTDERKHSHVDGKGNLVLTATREVFEDQYGSRDYSSARLVTKGTFAVTYGRIEARVKVPDGQGLWPAFWALGANKDQVEWPRSGEIDVMEVLGGKPEQVWGHLHGLGDERDHRGGTRNEPVSSLGGNTTPGDLSTGMHTYAADLQPGAVTFSVDGRPYFVAAQEDMRAGQQWPIGHPYFLLLNLAVGGTWGGPPDGGTEFPGRLVVDSVVVTGWP